MLSLLLLACKPEAEIPTDLPTVPAEDTTCERWAAIRALEDPVYTGAPATCDLGGVDEQGLDDALTKIDYLRELAGQAPFTRDPALSATAQVAAVLMHANDDLSHTPTSDWTCWTQEGADVADRSLLVTAPAVEGVMLYMVDIGNASTLVHRRWLLSDWIDTIGIGSTDEFSAIDLGGEYTTGRGWTAWPPPGRVPLTAMRLNRNDTVDSEGWSIQSDDLDLEGATVQVTGPAGPLPVIVSDLGRNFGSVQALKILPDGWSAEPGAYRVELPDQGIDYTVEFVRCGE